MKTEFIPYNDNGVELEGFSAHPSEEKRPVVILCHAWAGRDPYIMEKAKLMSEWGYVGFALDMYGKGVLGKTREENAALKLPFIKDRQMLQKRLIKALEVVTALPYADKNRIAVVGFGFGGLCALDFARSGANLKGVISVYGHYESPKNVPLKPILAKVLVLHGYNDPIVTMKELGVFQQEMDNLKVDWQVQLFSNCLHAFTNPSANDAAFGTLYNPLATNRSWISIKNYINEILI